MKIKRAFIKGTNWALAGLLGLFGFSGCDTEPKEEYGVPFADYTVKGAVVDKATGKPIEGIRLGYWYAGPMLMYGVPSTQYREKASVTSNAKGEYTLKDRFSIDEMIPDDNSTPTFIPVFVSDIDGKENGLYSDTILNVNIKDAVRTGKQKGWYGGEYTVKVDIELKEKTDNE
jgi:hypothetical protein